MRANPRAYVLAIIGLLVTVLVAACSSDNDSSSSSGSTGSKSGSATASSSADVCEDYANLESSLNNLTNLKLTAVGTDGLTAAVNDIKSDLTALKSSSKDQYSSQIDALNTAISNIQSTLSSLNGGSITSQLGTLATQVAAVGAAAVSLRNAVKGTCPSSSSS